MPRLALSTVSVGFILLTLTVTPTMISAHATMSYTPGVSVGQWAKYKILYDRCTSINPSDCDTARRLNDTDYGLLQVAAVAGTNITLQRTFVHKNGSSTRDGGSVDVASGASTIPVPVPGYSQDYFVLAANLFQNEPIWAAAGAPILNKTLSEAVLGHTRLVNFLNFSSTFSTIVPFPSSTTTTVGFAFDAVSGVFIEISFSFTSDFLTDITDQQFAIGMVDNNLPQWAGGTLPDYILTANPTTINIPAPGTATGTTGISATGYDGFSADIGTTITTSSSSLSCSLSSTTLHVNVEAAILSCSGQPGTYTVTITGNASFIIRAVQITVNITGNPDFTISSSSGISFHTGDSGSTTITITAKYGYSSTATLDLTTTPKGLTCGLDKATITGTGSSTLSCSGSPGTYTVTIKATSGSITHTAQTTVTVSAAAATQPSPTLAYEIYAALGVIAAAIVVLAFLFLRRKPKIPT